MTNGSTIQRQVVCSASFMSSHNQTLKVLHSVLTACQDTDEREELAVEELRRVFTLRKS